MNKKEKEAVAGVLAAIERVTRALERRQASQAAAAYAALIRPPEEKSSGKSGN